MTFKAFIFDFDGTLADSLADLAFSINHSLRIQGFPERSLEEVRGRIGYGIDKLVTECLPEKHQDNKKIIARSLELMAQEYGRTWKKNTCLYPDIANLLDQLMIHKITLAILSNKPETFLQEMVDFLMPKWEFVKVIGGRGNYPDKPNPQSTIAIIEALGLTPEEVALVGDGDTDIKTAIGAGIQPIAATWGFRSQEELTKVGAKVFIHSPLELLNYIKKSPL